MVNKTKKRKKLMRGGILLFITIFTLYWIQPINGQCQQLRKADHKTAEDSLKSAIKKIEETKSLHTKVSMKMEVEVFDLDVGTDAVIDMVSHQSPYKVRSQGTLNMGLLGEKEWSVYAVKNNEKYMLYEKKGKKWNAQEVKAKELIKYDGRNMMKIYLSQIEEIEKERTEKWEDREVIRYSGIINKDGLKKILLDAGSIELVDKLFQNSLLKPFGTLLEQKDKVSEMIETSIDMPVTIWIDQKSGYPLQCTMNITDVIDDTYKELTKSMSSDKARKLAEKVKIEKAEIIIECDDFNEAEIIVIPKT